MSWCSYYSVLNVVNWMLMCVTLSVNQIVSYCTYNIHVWYQSVFLLHLACRLMQSLVSFKPLNSILKHKWTMYRFLQKWKWNFGVSLKVRNLLTSSVTISFSRKSVLHVVNLHLSNKLWGWKLLVISKMSWWVARNRFCDRWSHASTFSFWFLKENFLNTWQRLKGRFMICGHLQLSVLSYQNVGI